MNVGVRIRRWAMKEYVIAEVNGVLQLVSLWSKQELAAATKEELLDAAISKWNLIVETMKNGEQRPIHDGGGDTCALCAEYWDWNECTGCPVSEVDTSNRCGGSPYAAYKSAVNEGKDFQSRLAAAQAELEFLEGLRYGDDYDEDEDDPPPTWDDVAESLDTIEMFAVSIRDAAVHTAHVLQAAEDLCSLIRGVRAEVNRIRCD